MNLRNVFYLILCASWLCPEAASAEERTDSVCLRDVEVVSVKRNESNPLEPVTRLDAEQIREYNIEAVKDVSTITPNFFMPDYGSRMTSSIYVRGLGTRIDQPVVGMNVDNVPYLNKDNYDFDLMDIDRIEVIRGSVSVLNGRNAMGGQINIHTLSPWKTSGLKALVEYGKANSARAGVGYYHKISTHVASGLTASYHHTDGYYRNACTGEKTGRENAGNIRWKLSWVPESRWSLMNVAAVNVGKQDGYPYQSLQTGKIAYNDPTYYRRTAFTDGLTVSYTGNRMIASSVTSVQYSDDNMTLDQDFLPADIFTMSQKRKEWAVTQDLYAKGKRGVYSWIMGGFGFYKGTRMHAPVTFLETGLSGLIEGSINKVLPPGMQLAFDERNLLLDSHFRIVDGGFALYHQSSVTLGDFVMQGGLRWDIEHIRMDYNSDADASVTMYRAMPTGVLVPLATRPLAVHDNGRLKQTFSELLPQVSIGYNGKPWQVSARLSKGYKAGGYNTQMFSDILQQQLMEAAGMEAAYDINGMLTYKPEKAWTYELSAEYTHPSGCFDAEVVGYLMKVRNQQLTVFPDGNGTGRAMTNAGRTRSRGVEVTATWKPVQALSLQGSYGYTDARFTRYDNGKADMAGKRLPYAPSHTMFLSGRYTLPQLRSVQPVLAVWTRGAGNIYWDDANTVSQKFYATLSASLTFEHKLGSLGVWGENLTDTRFDTFYFVSMGNRFVQRGRPLTCGVTLRLNLDNL